MDIYTLKFTILELEIFSLLCLHAGEKFSQRELAKMLFVSATAISHSIPKLKEDQLITLEKTKTINFISINRDGQRAIDLKRVENLKNVYSSGLSNYLEAELPGGTILLFGSYSRGEDTKNSDIDIAVIGRKVKTLHLEDFERSLFRTITIQYYNSWKEIHKHLKNNILNGILLQGSVQL